MLINVILIVLATHALVSGLGYIGREKKRDVAQQSIFVSSIGVFFWCLGCGIMGMSTDISLCYLWRSVALAGVSLFVVSDFFFVAYITGFNNYKIWIFGSVLAVVSVILWYLVSRPEVVSFYMIGDRMGYTSAPCFARKYQSVVFAVLFALEFYMAIRWYTTFVYKREKHVFFLLLAAHISMLIMMSADTLLPTMGVPSFPSSPIGGFLCHLLNIIALDRFRLLDLSKVEISNFISSNVESSVLFFDCRGRLITSNNFAASFLSIGEKEKPRFSELFALENDDADKVLKDCFDARTTMEKHLKTRKDGIYCSLVLSPIMDIHGDPLCMAVTIYDRTREVEEYERIHEMKAKVEAELDVRTQELDQLSLQAIRTIARTIDAKDDYTKGHSERVAEYSCTVARRMGLSEKEIRELYQTGLMHDIGKIGIQDDILKKPGRLTDEEYDQIKKHTLIGQEILGEINLIPHLSDGAAYHHEWYNGNGYPYHIKGEDIPFFARIIGIADAYDAMSSRRVYRDSLPKDAIYEQMIRGSGTQFDPEILKYFIEEFFPEY